MPQPEAIRELVEICRRAAAGDLEARTARTPADPELAELAHAINHLLDISDAYVRESTAALEHCSRGEFHRPILERGLKGSYRQAARTINGCALKMRNDAETIGRFEQERAAVARRVAATTDSLTQSSQALRETSNRVSEHVGATRQLATEVSQNTIDASQNINAVAAACEELSACTNEITRRTTESAKLTHDAVNETSSVQKAVGHLDESTRKIGSVVDVINKITRQTNLLALNATIEAARAGEHGRSFAVVAAEVKNLSRETAAATERITGQIEVMQAATANVGKVIGGVVGAIHRIDETAGAIARSIREQSMATDEIARRIGDVSQATSMISERMTQMEQAAAGLEQVTAGLNDAAGHLATDAAALQRETKALAG